MTAPPPRAGRRSARRSTATSWCWASAARWARRWRAWPSGRRRGKRVIGVARFSEPGVREALGQGRRRADRRPTCSIARALESAAEGRQRRLHGRPQVRRHRRRAAHLGDERAGAGDGGRGVQGLAHRRLLDRLRLSLRAGRQRRRDRGRAAGAAARRLRQFLRRPRAHVRVLLGPARHAGPPVPPELRDRHALRRAARRRPQGARRRDRSTSPWAMST